MYIVTKEKTLKKPRKRYVVTKEKTLKKLKKRYVVGADKKLVKLWSSFEPTFVITGDYGHYALSNDLVNWEHNMIPSVDFTGSSASGGIAYGNGVFVWQLQKYNGAYGYIAVSSDGKTWNVVRVCETSDISTAGKLSFCNNKFIMMYDTNSSGNGNKEPVRIYTSEDGMHWTSVSSETVNVGGSCFGNNNVYDSLNSKIVYGYLGGKWRYILPVRDKSSWCYTFTYSDDLINWTLVSNDEQELLTYSFFVDSSGDIYSLVGGSEYSSDDIKLLKLVANGYEVVIDSISIYSEIIGACLNSDIDEIAIIYGDLSSDYTYPRAFLSTKNNITGMNSAISAFSGYRTPTRDGLIYGNKKYASLSCKSVSSTSILQTISVFYSFNGSEWTESIIDPTGDYNMRGTITHFCYGE